MTIEQKTPHQAYPLPHPTNQLEQDVLRLTDALKAIDGDVYDLLQADIAAMNARSELKTYIEGEQQALADDLTLKLRSYTRKQRLNHLLGESIFTL